MVFTRFSFVHSSGSSDLPLWKSPCSISKSKWERFCNGVDKIIYKDLSLLKPMGQWLGYHLVFFPPECVLKHEYFQPSVTTDL
jgi:hypothetical protein